VNPATAETATQPANPKQRKQAKSMAGIRHSARRTWSRALPAALRVSQRRSARPAMQNAIWAAAAA